MLLSRASGFAAVPIRNAQVAPRISSASQQAWIQLFNTSPSFQQRYDIPIRQTNPAPLAPRSNVNMLPVGADYEFIDPREWPSGVSRLTNSVFSTKHPYPVTKEEWDLEEKCGCEGRCVVANGTPLNSACLNAASCTLCDRFNCSAGQGCGNRFDVRYHFDLIETSVGLGVVCDEFIPEGAFVIEYIGEILFGGDARRRSDRRYQVKLKSKTTWNVSIYVDALHGGNESRFINHSCRPNCVMFEFDWTNTARLGLFASRDIPPMQELTFRYRCESLKFFTCACRNPNCVTLQN